MQIHSLDCNDFSEDNYSLIAIHTTLEDYMIAYLLNYHLNTHLAKASYNLDFKKDTSNLSFSIYNYTNVTYDFDWFLIANSSKEDKNVQSQKLLFNSETKNYLIPEKKNVDFFLKITGDSTSDFILKTVTEIKKINQVITSYSIEHQTLKSKDFLIF
jgi:hypothetical protein